MQRLEAHVAVSVSELKKSPTAIMNAAAGDPVAVLNHNKVLAYMIPAEVYEAMIERLDDMELVKIINSRSDQAPVGVNLDEL